VPRSTWLVVEWLEKDGELKREQFEGYLARVLQHELDHLIGKLFTDRMDPSTLTTVDNWRKFHSGS